mmetsp:Transcript_92426/g.128305  ORF Transcript_92426/g.128305 Transcript_92426/m.128305 type:complete len:246 (-) Transcript_92426:174-911(-)
MLRLAVLVAALAAVMPSAFAARGALTLDSLTFDKVVTGNQQILVKFDKQYPYGEKEDAYKEFLKDVAKTTLLVGEVGVQDYGDKENDDLRERFNVNADDYPVFKMFKNGASDPITYTGDVTADGLRAFVTKEAGVWIGLQGTIESFDKIAQAVAAGKKTAEDGLKEATKVEEGLSSEDEKKSARMYTTILKKIKEKGSEGKDFATKEIKRVEGLVKTKISEAKKETLQTRLNILQSFVAKDKADL